MLFIPVVAVFLTSQAGAQWMFLAISGVMVELNQEVRKELEALDNVVVLGIIHLRRDERVPGTNIQHRIDQFVIRRADGSVEPVRWKLQDAPSELVEIRVLGSE